MTIATVHDRTGTLAEMVPAESADRRTLEEIAADLETEWVVARFLRQDQRVKAVRVAAFNSYI